MSFLFLFIPDFFYSPLLLCELVLAFGMIFSKLRKK